MRLAHEGYSVGVIARRADRLDEVAADVRDIHGTVHAHVCDVSDPVQVREAVAACRLALGPIELLVANAGVSGRTSAEDLVADDVERVMYVNFMGAVWVVEAVLPEMLRRGSGQIVAVSSLAGFAGLPGRAAYCASKGAMTNFFESLRPELRGKGVAVTVICPGFVRTEMTREDGRRRPLLMEIDPALDKMMRAIVARRRTLIFPWPAALFVKVGQWLPRWAYDALASLVRG